MKDLGIMRCQGIRAPLYIDVTYAEPFLSHTKRMDSSNPPGCFFHNTQALSHSLSLREMYRLFSSTDMRYSITSPAYSPVFLI